MTQPFQTAAHNSATSLNKHVSSVLTAMALPVNQGGIGVTVGLKVAAWQPQPYPGLTITVIREPQPNARLKRYESEFQMDFYVKDRNLALCRKIAGEFMTRMGFDIETMLLQTSVPQYDWASGSATPAEMQEMDLEITSVFDSFTDEDPDVSRQKGAFKLIFY